MLLGQAKTPRWGTQRSRRSIDPPSEFFANILPQLDGSCSPGAVTTPTHHTGGLIKLGQGAAPKLPPEARLQRSRGGDLLGRVL